jgi:tryptophan synthase alpha subunit
VTGTTGERAALAADVSALATRARTTVPVAVGFGIATPSRPRAALRPAPTA